MHVPYIVHIVVSLAHSEYGPTVAVSHNQQFDSLPLAPYERGFPISLSVRKVVQ